MDEELFQLWQEGRIGIEKFLEAHKAVKYRDKNGKIAVKWVKNDEIDE